MPFATWWRGDPLPELPSLPSFSARRVARWDDARRVTGLTEDRALVRYQGGHRLYAAYLGEQAVAYGWAAKATGGIEELDFSFLVPGGNCYLWDFVTLPAWRGRGIYPHLLQEIVRQEDRIERFWIGYEAHNEASARGISKAGFRVVGDLAVADGRVASFVVFESGERAQAAGALLGLPIVEQGDAGL
jgi:GNAT superfamily N-acetyltransferase